MKIIYDKDGRLSEVIGSGENGDFTDNEQKIVAELIKNDKEIAELREKNFHDEKMKAFEENRIIQVEISKNQAEMSKTSSQTYGKFWDALGSLAIASCCPDPHPNQLPPNQNSQPKKVN